MYLPHHQTADVDRGSREHERVTRMFARRRKEGVAFFLLFVATIVLANIFIQNVSIGGAGCVPDGPCLMPVAPGIDAPSGVLFIGLAFTLRDLVQRRLGVRFAAVAVVFGAVLSGVLDPALAVASGVAFLLAEFLDLAVYTPLQRRNLTLAVVASNIVGLVVDTFVFLLIAFGSTAHYEGQLVGKAWMVLIAVPVIHAIREWDKRRGMLPHYVTA